MMNNQNMEIIKLVMDFLLKAYTDIALKLNTIQFVPPCVNH